MGNKKYNVWVKEQLCQQQEAGFGAFTARLLPGVRNILGVRLPYLRKMAKQLAGGDWQDYLIHAADDSYEEIMLQGMVLGYAKGDLQVKEPYLRAFIPKIDNWSVCDSACATIKLAKTEPEEMWAFLQEYLYGTETYGIRFGLVQLLDYYINPAYLSRVLDTVGRVYAEDYYVKMAQAWAISICYREYPEETLPFLRGNCLDDFTHNKAIQKIIESRKVPDKEKDRLRAMRRRG